MPHRLKRIVTSARFIALTATVLALLLVYALGGFLLAPYLVERYLPRYAQEHLGREASVAEVRVNPFLLTAEARGFKLLDPGGSPMLAFERAYVDLELASLVRRAWTFRTVTLEGGEVSIRIDPSGRSNIAELAQRLQKPAPPQPQTQQGPPRMTIGELQVTRAALRYEDRSHREPVTALIQPINLTANSLSTIAGEQGEYKLSAALPRQAALEGHGTLSLQPLASAGEARLERFELATAWPFLRDVLHIAEPRGSLTLHGRYEFQQAAPQPRLAITALDLQLSGVALALAGAGQPLLEVTSAHAQGGRYDFATRELVVPSLQLSNGRFVAALDAKGRFNWSQLHTATDSKPDAGAQWSARIDAVKLQNIAVRYADSTRRRPLFIDVASGDAALKLAIAAKGGTTRTTAQDVNLSLSNLSLTQADAREPLVKLASAALTGGRVDTGERVISVAEAILSGGSAALAREADGSFALAKAFASATATTADSTSGKAPPSPGWTYRIDAARLEDTRLAYSDQTYDPALRYDVELASLALKNVDPASKTPMTFQATAKSPQGGTLQASGTAAQGYDSAQAKLELSGLSVLPMQPLLAKTTTLELKSGTLAGSATVDYVKDGKPMLRAVGGVKATGVDVNEGRSKQRFLALKTLAADSLALTLSPDRLDIKDVLVDQLETAIIISKERSVNLTQVLKKSNAQAKDAELAPATERSTPAAGGEPFPVRIGRLRLQNGTLDFADYSLVLPFSTRVTRLNGSVLGITTSRDGRAELKLGGRIETSGYASAEGGVNLRAPTEFMDINVKFQNVEMPPLSPYTATFAGRKIAGGRLWLDLDYKILHQQLAGENKVLLENVELGERVEAPNALDLPLDLAIALLKDPQGRINMAVPVTGDVGSPKFDYGALIGNAIGTALKRIVTAPFRALASLFGGGSADELSKVRFSPGSARLFPPQREALQKVAKALQERPQLKVVIHGAYDPKRDAERLRLAPVRRDLAAAMGTRLAPGEDPGPIPYSDPETQRVIEKLFVARAGRDALRAFADDYARLHGGKAPAEGDQRRAYYEALFDKLVELYPLPDTALQQLAGERSQAIGAFLQESGVDASRIETGALRTITDTSEPTVNADLALST